ncbi:Sentrin-specific protease 2 [Dissostichus eleginoides]|uniref:Sentrin-specific protease 2 n=1 Tax=Dissostichus eleginoides TaxID=100907 RepID=A0AAD9F9X7_DISEL|nr:Sentrin-specific protease 2 [Dissostichus eleginoides]
MEVHLEACLKLPSTSCHPHQLLNIALVHPLPLPHRNPTHQLCSLSCFQQQQNLSQSINPGPWKETTGLEIEGFPRQLYGNDCGIFMLMYALYTILDAPYDFTIIDMPALRKMVVCHANGEFRPRKSWQNVCPLDGDI